MVVDGIYYALGFTVGGVVVGFLTHPAFGIPLYLLALFCLYFFRDPNREIPTGPVAVSPADGKVVITSAQLGMLLEGIDWRMPRRTWRPQLAR